MIRGLLVDFGGVVVDAPFAAFAEYERELGLPPGTVRAVNATDPDTNAWARFERGELDAEGFAAAFAAEARALAGAAADRLDPLRLVAALRELPMTEHAARAGVLAAIDTARARGLRAALVTNNVVPMAGNPATAWVFERFDAVVESCLLGARKPEPAMYLRALELLEVEPAAAVMLDDLGINLKPARALGIATIKVTDVDTALAELDGLLRTA